MAASARTRGQLNRLHQRHQVPGRHRPDARALGRRGGEPERPRRTPTIKGQHQRRPTCATLRRTGRCGQLRLPPCCARQSTWRGADRGGPYFTFSRSLGAYIASIVLRPLLRQLARGLKLMDETVGRSLHSKGLPSTVPAFAAEPTAIPTWPPMRSPSECLWIACRARRLL